MTATLKGKRVTVTEQIIEKSMRQNSARCMTAVGIAQSVEGAHRIQVDTQTIRFSVGDERYVFVTPAAVMQYVVDFDAGHTIEPFTFRLPEPVQVKTRRLTDHGKALQRADNDRRRKPQQQALPVEPAPQIAGQGELIARDPEQSTIEHRREVLGATPAERTAALADVEIAEADVTDDERAALDAVAPAPAPAPAKPVRKATASDGVKPPRAVLGKNRREYGTRKLRWNQLDELAGAQAEAVEGSS